MKLEIRDLCVSYGGIRALKGVSLSVDEGQIVTLIGANGAGKSTTLRAISGLQKVQSGSILYGGEELTSLPAKEIVRRGIIHVPEGRRVFPDMTVAENLKFFIYFHNAFSSVWSMLLLYDCKHGVACRGDSSLLPFS